MENTILNFSDCTLDLLDNQFQLKQVKYDSVLDAWLNYSEVDIDWEKTVLKHLQQLLILNVHDWNEFELIQHFIGPIFALINFTTDYFNIFAERPLRGIVEGTEMKGSPDGIIASGRRSPQKPYFCFQEYKKETNYDRDPAGQCLAAMLVAQEINEHKYPVYGCYVIGRNWFFMTLHGKEYAISNEYVATKDDIFVIFCVLKSLKTIIIDMIKEDS
jgi:hypothetical protein